MFGYYKGVHAWAARDQRLELYAVDLVRVPGSPDAPAPHAAVTSSRGRGAAPASGEACVNRCEIRGLMPGALASAGRFDQAARLAAGNRAAPHDDLVGDTWAAGRTGFRRRDGSRQDTLGAARSLGCCGRGGDRADNGGESGNDCQSSIHRVHPWESSRESDYGTRLIDSRENVELVPMETLPIESNVAVTLPIVTYAG
jgi:hypothetical protein